MFTIIILLKLEILNYENNWIDNNVIAAVLF